ncbi:unnamed protein product [Aureobasidium vineae]|uniref:Uncharacterized protein n=1 Tax=Aureobasidium vineae TaxID=2773715 RepID=A0A9N8P6E0_9PEZI|nr:unnamed protein product [Aureobasidium vineae]
MIPRINLFTRFLKTLDTQDRIQTVMSASITQDMIGRYKNAVEENAQLRDENGNLRVRNYELNRELDVTYRKLWSLEIEGGGHKGF